MKIVVTAHAVVRYQQRTRSTLPYHVAKQEVEQMVRAAAGARQVLDHKPKSWRLYGESKARARLLPGQRFVGDPAGQIAWIVLVEGDQWTVMTTLLRPGGRQSAWENFEQRRVAELETRPVSAGEDLRPEEAEAYPVGDPKRLAFLEVEEP